MYTPAGFRVYARTDREHKEPPQNSSALRRSLIACGAYDTAGNKVKLQHCWGCATIGRPCISTHTHFHVTVKPQILSK